MTVDATGGAPSVHKAVVQPTAVVAALYFRSKATV